MPKTDQEEIVLLPVASLVRGFFQPRDYFDDLAMESTRRSIAEKGQMYPVIVRVIKPENPLFNNTWTETHYELADGERRYRCCKELGLKTIKAIVRDLSDEQMLDYTLSTNDSLPLNVIERAQVFYRLTQEFGKSQEDVAKSFNMKQQQVSEFVRLLELPKEVQDLTARAVISIRHAREILKVSDSEIRLVLGLEVAASGMSTRDLSKRVRAILAKDGSKIDINDINFENKLENVSKSGISSSITEQIDASIADIDREDRLKYRPKDEYFDVVARRSKNNYTFMSLLSRFNAFIIRNVIVSRSKLIDKSHPGSIDVISKSLAAAELAVFCSSAILFSVYLFNPWLAMIGGAICGAALLYIYIERA